MSSATCAPSLKGRQPWRQHTLPTERISCSPTRSSKFIFFDGLPRSAANLPTGVALDRPPYSMQQPASDFCNSFLTATCLPDDGDTNWLHTYYTYALDRRTCVTVYVYRPQVIVHSILSSSDFQRPGKRRPSVIGNPAVGNTSKQRRRSNSIGRCTAGGRLRP